MNYQKYSALDFAKDSFFIRWIKGDPDQETDWFWKSFLKEHPEKFEAVEQARHMINALNFSEDKISQDTLGSMRNRLIMEVQADKENEKEREQELPFPIKAKGRFNVLKWAAIILFPLLAIGLYSTKAFKARVFEEISSTGKVDKKIEQRLNPRGQKSVLLLSDGSKIWLNADSKVNYAKNFDHGDTREVFLEGEAYFDVAPNPKRPFIVQTSAIRIRVLGTAFNVKSYQEDKTIETTLVHGKVSINKISDDLNEGSLILKPNQRAIFQKKMKTINVEEVEAAAATVWHYDHLVFDETPYHEALTQIERWYDVKIHLEKEQDLNCLLTADIDKESLDDVLKLLEVSNKINYTVDGQDVYIKGTLCK
ncbi:MAG: FecR family protein [Chryseolinea sp.]